MPPLNIPRTVRHDINAPAPFEFGKKFFHAFEGITVRGEGLKVDFRRPIHVGGDAVFPEQHFEPLVNDAFADDFAPFERLPQRIVDFMKARGDRIVRTQPDRAEGIVHPRPFGSFEIEQGVIHIE